jgi:hypothetical protein
MAAIMVLKIAAKMNNFEYIDTNIPQNNAFGGYDQICWVREFIGCILLDLWNRGSWW